MGHDRRAVPDRRGHVPIVGVNLARPIITARSEAAGRPLPVALIALAVTAACGLGRHAPPPAPEHPCALRLHWVDPRPDGPPAVPVRGTDERVQLADGPPAAEVPIDRVEAVTATRVVPRCPEGTPAERWRFCEGTPATSTAVRLRVATAEGLALLRSVVNERHAGRTLAYVFGDEVLAAPVVRGDWAPDAGWVEIDTASADDARALALAISKACAVGPR